MRHQILPQLNPECLSYLQTSWQRTKAEAVANFCYFTITLVIVISCYSLCYKLAHEHIINNANILGDIPCFLLQVFVFQMDILDWLQAEK